MAKKQAAGKATGRKVGKKKAAAKIPPRAAVKKKAAATSSVRASAPAPPVKLPLGDHYGWACRLAKRIREGESIADAVASAKTYARDVCDSDCVEEAANFVGREAGRLRTNCTSPTEVIERWQKVAVKDLPPGREYTERKLAYYFSKMYREISGWQIGEAAREAAAQAEQASKAQDKQRATQWRKAAANLEAMRKSVVDGGFVEIPYPNG